MTDLTGENKKILKGILEGDPRFLAKGITLVESQKLLDQKQAEILVSKLLPKSGKSIRLGITGTPGAGKSTFIENFGLYLCDQGKKLAVLSIDPSSSSSGGSILGDKTRMERLSTKAFIRPSPSGGHLGGAAMGTRSAMILLEAFGFDLILVETVGVGQSESEIDGLTDSLIMLFLPSGGDEVQGIKKGNLELADILIVNKCDGPLLEKAKEAKQKLKASFSLTRPKYSFWNAPVLCLSSLYPKQGPDNFEKVWQSLKKLQKEMHSSGFLKKRRLSQDQKWFESTLLNLFENYLLKEKAWQNYIGQNEILKSPLKAAAKVFESFQKENS